MKGKKAHAAAAREALEEAGITGKVGKRSVGAYSYGKLLSNGAVLSCRVQVYPMAVRRQMKRWPERDQRSRKWFSPSEAAQQVDEPELADLIERFAVNMSR
jgi:8-oxo-dGTP pyrophosphatase MutT (NUDIX family)